MDYLSENVDDNKNDRLGFFIANSAGYWYCKNVNLDYVSCNYNYAALLGVASMRHVIGKKDTDFNWFDNLNNSFNDDEELVLATQKTQIKEYQFLNGDKAIYLRFERVAIFNDQDVLVGIQATGLDITDSKLREQKTMAEHAFVEDILYNLPGLIYWKNRQSQYMGFNRNVVELSGLTRETLEGKTDRELNWGRKEGDSFVKDDQEVIETGVVKISEHEIPIRRVDGNYVIVRTEKSRLFDRNGNIAGVLGVALDITDQKMLEAKLLKENERVERLNKSKTEFIRNMEHDIRTPFCGIYSMIQVLSANEIDPGKKECLDAVSMSAKELLDYCNGILDFSKLESGTLPITQKKFDLAKLIDEVFKIELPIAHIKKLRFSRHYAEGLPTVVIGDQFRIQRILINLVSNAIKFTQEGFVKIFVKGAKKSVDSDQLIVQLIIKDTGIGISQENIAYIYEKFERLTPSNKGINKGSGLGLSIVKQLISEIDGEIDVNSDPDTGTTFICTIPFKVPLLSQIPFQDGNHEL